MYVYLFIHAHKTWSARTYFGIGGSTFFSSTKYRWWIDSFLLFLSCPLSCSGFFRYRKSTFWIGSPSTKDVLFGLLRMGFGQGRLRRTKYVFIHAIGDKVPAVTRGKKSAQRPKMEELMGSYASISVMLGPKSAKMYYKDAVGVYMETIYI